MYILGISCYYHDSSATLLKDGRVAAAAEEERFTRKKHDCSFPVNAISYCLKSQGIEIADIAYVSYYEKPILKFERILHQHIKSYPSSLKTFLASMPSWLTKKLRILNSIRNLGYKGEVHFVGHHMSHAASAFFPSPFSESAILTIDGVGEWSTTSYGKGTGSDIELIKELRFPHSIGLLYSTITAYLGFSVNNSEYKVMGLAAYGNKERETNIYYQKLRQVLIQEADASFSLDMSYFTFDSKDRMPGKRLCSLLGGPITKHDSEMTDRHRDIAAALQMLTEDTVLDVLRHVHEKTGSENIVFAGGVALNSVLNGKILKSTPFKQVWIQPNATDGGNSMGAALYTHHMVLENTERKKLDSAYLGPSYTDEEIKQYLQKNRIIFSEFGDDKELLQRVAKMIYNNKVVGWFQGRMEWGPRALGSRSILANPCNPEAKQLLNERVKHREKFRPFAPVVCEDDAAKYFECDSPVPEPTDFMLMVYPVKEKWHKRIPSVVHVDGSGRLQTIRKNQNPLYYSLVKEFGRRSKIPILINTSFNIRGEPIVCTPEDAYRCMMGTGIDCTVMGRYLIRREDNEKDIWDSEKNAKD